MGWLLWFVLSSVQLAVVPLGEPPSAGEMKRFERNCNENVHVSCIREGVSWLQTKKLSLRQRRSILAHVAMAYSSVGRIEDAKKAMRKVVLLAPCASAPSGLSPRTLRFFQQMKKEVFQADQAPPILSFLPPEATAFQKHGTMHVKATDDLHVRDVTLFYRMAKQGMFRAVPFAKRRKGEYSVHLSTKLLQKSKVFHFYIVARDCANHQATNQADATHPIKFVFQEKGSSAKTIGATVLIATGGALVVASSLAFLNVGIDQERWKRTKDLEESEKLRSRIILVQSLAWTGVALGLLSAGFGVYMLLPKKNKAKGTPPPVVSRATKQGVIRFSHSASAIYEELEL